MAAAAGAWFARRAGLWAARQPAAAAVGRAGGRRALSVPAARPRPLPRVGSGSAAALRPHGAFGGCSSSLSASTRTPPRWRSDEATPAAEEPAAADEGAGEAVPDEAVPDRVGLIEAMVRHRVHYGHAPGLWNPKMAPYIAGQRAGMHVIDLEKTAVALEKALHLIRGVVDAKGTILFVNTRNEFETMTRRAAIACGEHFVVRKWVGGTLTNSDGVLGLSTRADLVILLSMPVLPSAIRDASQLCIPTIGIADTDCDPTAVTIAIPGNDDSADAVRFYLDVMCNAIIDVKEGMRDADKAAAPRRGEA